MVDRFKISDFILLCASHLLFIHASAQNTISKENETLLAVGTAYVQGEDVARRARVLLFSVEKNPDSSQTTVNV